MNTFPRIPFVMVFDSAALARPSDGARGLAETWMSQQGNALANDCGPACDLMLLRALGLALDQSVEALAHQIQRAGQYTSSAENTQLLTRYGLTPVLGEQCTLAPYVMLVDYAHLPPANRLDASGRTFAHWIVVIDDGATTGIARYHDPFHVTGGNLPIPREQLTQAELGTANRYGVAELLPLVALDRDFDAVDIEIQAGTNLRLAPDRHDPANIAGESAPFWARARGKLGEADAEGHRWWQVGGVTFTPDANPLFGKRNALPRAVFAREDLVRTLGENEVLPPPVDPIPVKPDDGLPVWMSRNRAARELGVSVLTDHRRGFDALAAGCRSVLFLDGLLTAVDAAKRYPDAVIFARLWTKDAPSPQSYADALGAGMSEQPQNLYRTIANESDWFKYHEPGLLHERFNYERAVCERVWERNPNAMMCVGQFSHGTPDITNEAIVRAWIDSYGRFALDNPQRVRVGWHLYTFGKRIPAHPPADAQVIDPVWFEGRDASFASRLGAPVRFVCDETGVEAGHGGINWAAYSKEQFAEWCAWWLNYRATLPVAHDGMCLFQLGDHPGWRGYDIVQYFDVLAEFWQGRRVASATRGLVPTYAPPPVGYAPAPKVLLK